MTRSAAENSILRIHRAIHPGFGTEAAVYGTILVSGLIAVASFGGGTSFQVLLKVAVSVIIFWGAHVFAGTVARMGEHASPEARAHMGAAFRASLTHSLGMLTSASVPALVLLAGTTRIIPDDIANDVALWSGVVILAFLGYVAFLRRGSSHLVRICGSLATASFGLAFVVMKALIH